MGPQLATISLVLLTLFVNSHSTTVPLVAYTSEDVVEGYDEGSGETAGFFEMEPTTEQPDLIDFDCNGLENGNYADGCSNVFYMCSNNVAFGQYCPQGTVYNPNQKACDYDCTESVTTTTTAYSEPTTTRKYDQPEYTTTSQDDVTSTTVVYETTPASDDTVTTTATTTTTTTQAPIVCQEGQVTTFGMCSSRFNRCQSNTVRSKQCPVNTLFESSLLLCVFDLPQCQPVTIPAAPVYNSYGPPSDTIVSPFDENVLLKPKFDRKHNYHHGPAPVRRPGYGNGNSYIENPFFIPRHYPRHHEGVRRHHSGPEIDSPFSTAFRGRAALNDQFKDYRRASMGKINYGDVRKVEGNKRFLIDDEFDGPNARYVQSSIQQVFPEHRHSKKRLGPREDPDGYNDDKTFDGKDLFGATRRKRSAYYGSQPSGYTQISARQAQVNKDCQQYTTPTFLTFGDCFDQFIYCSGNGVNRMAACPIGETFNKALRACSETCGISTPVVTVTTGTQTSDDSTWSSINTGNDNSPNQVTDEQMYTTQAPSEDLSWNDQPTTTIAPAGGRCSSVPSGLFSLGCSQKYIQCSNGAALVRSCSGVLYFSQAKQSCDSREHVSECGAQDTTTWPPVVTFPADDTTPDETTDSYGNPFDDTQATTRTPVGDRCAYESSGLFAVGCSQKYIQCSSGAALVRSCSGVLYFNQAKQSCDSREHVSECGAQDTTTWSPIVTLPANADPYRTPSDDTQATTRTPIGDNCAYVSSGLFAVGCSQRYIQCSNGAAIVRNCGGSLYFSQDEQSCIFRDQVPECGAQDTTTWSPVVTTDITTSDDSYVAVPSDDYTTSSSYGKKTPASEDTSSYGEYTTSSEDQSWNEQPTTTIAPAGGRCSSVPSGLYSLGCSQKYIQCSNGAAVVRSCSGSLYFHQYKQLCVLRDRVPECGAQDTTTWSPVVTTDDTASDETIVPYVTVPSNDYNTTSSYGEETTTSSYGEYTTPVEDSGLIQPLPYVTLEDILSTTQATTTIGNDETTVSYVTVPSDDYTTTSSYGDKASASEATSSYGTYTTPAEDTTSIVVTDSYNRADDSEEEEEEIGYNQKCTVGSRASTGFCVQSYLECTANVFVEKSCRVGKLFDTHANRCVPRIACGKEAIREAIKDVIATTAAPTKKIDGRCAHVDGERSFALGSCSSNYVRCSYGAAKLQYCSGNQVFSNAKAECVNRESTSECNVSQNPPVKSYYNNNEQSAYCDGKADGLYGNKRDCSAILQCFGGELFEHTSCPSNLAFNELTSKCDYPQKVNGCENHGKTDGVCTEHGSFIANVDDCSVFYRCVWGRKVVMRCPSGTVFNPALSVCDWPSAVPSCGGSSYNDENLGY